ncbi:MAG: UDP-glucose 4-epimerase GalE [Candidatus Acidiferrales bacterium]
MKVLVTGGAGYIGSHAVRELARAGHEPVIYDNLSTGYREFTRGFEFIEGGLEDTETLARALRGAEAIMHFAAFIEAGESVANPRKYFRNNFEGSIHLLEAASNAGVHRFIFSSTAAVYGIPETTPIPETARLQPINPYGASKLAVEYALDAFRIARGLSFVSLRYFNAAGADSSGEIGESHQPESHLIPNALAAAVGSRPALAIFGNDYPTPDGTCIRDYIHVSDLAQAHVLALDYLSGGGDFRALNLGTGRGYSVLEIVKAAEHITRRKLPATIEPRRLGDSPVLLADASEAHRVLGWKPFHSLDDMIGSAWRWHQMKQPKK